jgi:dihydroneopterin aldolase
MFIGVNQDEKESTQRVIVNIELNVTSNNDWKSDEIGSVVSYADIVDLVKNIASKAHIELVETFAHQIIDACFAHSNMVKSAKVTLDKPDVIKGTKSVGCSLSKLRN